MQTISLNEKVKQLTCFILLYSSIDYLNIKFKSPCDRPILITKSYRVLTNNLSNRMQVLNSIHFSIIS